MRPIGRRILFLISLALAPLLAWRVPDNLFVFLSLLVFFTIAAIGLRSRVILSMLAGIVAAVLWSPSVNGRGIEEFLGRLVLLTSAGIAAGLVLETLHIRRLRLLPAVFVRKRPVGPINVEELVPRADASRNHDSH